MEKDVKKCNGCGEIKPIEEFGLNRDNRTGKRYRRSKCNTCKNRAKQLRQYGMKAGDYERMYEEQEGKCQICNIYHTKLVVDHCHNTGNVRGLLCDPCNKGLGFFKDNSVYLQNAINYLL